MKPNLLIIESTVSWEKALKQARELEKRKMLSKKDIATLKKIAGLMKHANESVNRDYKAEYKKYGSSTKAKKYRAELNQYNRKKGTYGNGDGKDASHKGGKIVGFESQSKNRGRAEKSRLKSEVLSRGGAIELFGHAKYLGQGIKDMTKAYKKKDWAQMEEEVDYIVTKAKLMGDIVKQKRYQESVNEGQTQSIDGKDLLNFLMKRFKMSKKKAIDSMKKHNMDMSFLKKESVNEGRKGPGAYINTFEKLLKKQMGKDFDKKPPSEKDIERVMGLMRKRYGEPNMYEKKLMKIRESGILYKAGVKKYGKEGMSKILSAAGKRKSHAEIGAIKDKYEKKGKKSESVNEGNFDRGTSGLPKGFVDDYTKIVKKLSKGKGYLTLSKSDKTKVWATLGKIYNESINEGIKDPKLKVGQKIRYKKSNRVFTLKKITHGNRGIPEDPAGTSYMFVAPGNRKEYHTKKTWAQAIKKGWLSLESVNEDVYAIVDKFNQKKQDYDQVYFKDNDLKKVKNHMKKMGSKYGKMNLIRVKTNGKMSLVESVNEASDKDVESYVKKKELKDMDLPFWKVGITYPFYPTKYHYVRAATAKLAEKQLQKMYNKESGGKFGKAVFDDNYFLKVNKNLKEGYGVFESVNEADLGLTLKKGKTVKVTHKTSEKELIIVDKPNVRKEYEKIGFYVEGKVNEAVEPKGNMAKIFKIVKDKQYAKIGGTIVDLFSASALVKIFDALNDSNKKKLNKMNINKLAYILDKAFKDKVVV